MAAVPCCTLLCPAALPLLCRFSAAMIRDCGRIQRGGGGRDPRGRQHHGRTGKRGGGGRAGTGTRLHTPHCSSLALCDSVSFISGFLPARGVSLFLRFSPQSLTLVVRACHACHAAYLGHHISRHLSACHAAYLGLHISRALSTSLSS